MIQLRTNREEETASGDKPLVMMAANSSEPVRTLLRITTNWVGMIFHFCCFVVDLKGFYSENPLVKLLYRPSGDILIYVGQSPSPLSLSSFFFSTQPTL